MTLSDFSFRLLDLMTLTSVPTSQSTSAFSEDASFGGEIEAFLDLGDRLGRAGVDAELLEHGIHLRDVELAGTGQAEAGILARIFTEARDEHHRLSFLASRT